MSEISERLQYQQDRLLDSKKLAATAQLQAVLKAVGRSSIALGIADVAMGCLSAILGCSLASSASYVWAGLLFALLNAKFALQVASVKKMDTSLAKLCLATGLSALGMHLVDFSLAITASFIYGQVSYYGNYVSDGHGANLRQVTPATAESARTVLLFGLLFCDSCQLYFVRKFRSCSNVPQATVIVVNDELPDIAERYLLVDTDCLVRYFVSNAGRRGTTDTQGTDLPPPDYDQVVTEPPPYTSLQHLNDSVQLPSQLVQ